MLRLLATLAFAFALVSMTSGAMAVPPGATPAGDTLAAAAGPAKARPESEWFQRIEGRMGVLRTRLRATVEGIDATPDAISGLIGRVGAEERPVLRLILAVLALVAGLLADLTVRRRMRRRVVSADGATPRQRLLTSAGVLAVELLACAVFAAAAGAVFGISGLSGTAVGGICLLVLLTVLAAKLARGLGRTLFSPEAPGTRLYPVDDGTARLLTRRLWAGAAAVAFIFLSSALIEHLALSLEASLFLRLFGGTLFAVLIIATVIQVRRPVACALAGGEPRAGAEPGPLARLWHVPVIAFVVLIWVLGVAIGLSGPQRTIWAASATLLLLLLLPVGQIAMLAWLGEAPGETGKSDLILRRAGHVLIAVVAALAMVRIWDFDLVSFGRESVGDRLANAALEIGIILFIGYVAWMFLGLTLSRYGAAEEAAAGGDEGGTGVSRQETFMPLLLRAGQAAIATIVVLVSLAALGVDIVPLVAGAGVVGLAIGFGAQSLVRDIVSGLFFLLDDAFRRGEYIDVGDVKGKVEHINIRSLVLRHHLGPLHTIPYGEIRYLTNYSRDWVIMKLEFHVDFDTDPNKVKKIFKQIGARLFEDPELGPDFIEPFKSQGVKVMEESAMVIRGKFTARPGRQFQIRKEVYNQVRQAFHDNGIKFASRRVTVQVPPGATGPEVEEAAKAAAAGAFDTDQAKSA